MGGYNSDFIITNMKKYDIRAGVKYKSEGGEYPLLSKIFKTGKKKADRITVKCAVCALPLISYDHKTETLDYGQCFSLEMTNISLNSITVRHANKLKKGDILEIRTKHALDDRQCLKCENFKSLTETPALSSFIGKVIWKNHEEAGFNIIMMRDRDRNYIKKMLEGKI